MRYAHLSALRSLFLGVLALSIAFIPQPKLSARSDTVGAVHSLTSPLQPPTGEHLLVSLEWVPSETTLEEEMSSAGCPHPGRTWSYLSDLEQGLVSMARYAYAFSNGNAQIQSITIDATGQHWNEADIRILANSSFRPMAFVGGNVEAITEYETANAGRMVFAPMPILLSRLWDGRRARCGPWSDPEGWRTLGHEWAHHALGLFDEYFSLDGGQPQYCQSDGFATLLPSEFAPSWIGNGISSLMAYHYTTDLLSGGGSSPGQHCLGTPQWVVHGEASWKTVETMFGWTRQLGPLPSPPTPTVEILRPADSSSNVSVSFNNPLPEAPVFGSAYLLQADPSGAFGPSRIISQGTIWPTTSRLPLRFWGVRSGAQDRVVLMLQEPVGGMRFSELPNQLLSSPTNVIAIEESPWTPMAAVTPLLGSGPTAGVNHVNGLQVDLYDARGAPLQIAYCPAGGPCLSLRSMRQDGPDHWAYAFRPSDFAPADGPAPYGYFYVRQSSGREVVFWYLLAGGVGPAHSDGLAPAAEGPLNVEMLQNSPFTRTSGLQVIYHPALASDHDLVSDSPLVLPKTVEWIGDTPLSVKIFPVAWSGGLSGKDGGMRVRLNYSQEILDQLGISEADEDRLVVLERVDNGQWFVADAALQQHDPHLNWISAPLTLGADGSAVVALGLHQPYIFPAGPVYLPIVSR